jgi:hypothetical protein
MPDTTDTPTAASDPTAQRATIPPDATPWGRLATADPIAIRDPLAEVLGMVPTGDPLSIPFHEVAKAAGHACPAVSGAFRSTQLALDALYPESLPVRSEIAVTVYGSPTDPGLGPMATVITHVTGAADETGFTGFGGYGGRMGRRTFDADHAAASTPGRTFDFTRTDTDETVRVTFDPDTTDRGPGADSAEGTLRGEAGGSALADEAGGSALADEAGGSASTGDAGAPSAGAARPAALLSKLVAGEATDAERTRFLDAWHGRVQRILESDAGADSPFTLEWP